MYTVRYVVRASTLLLLSGLLSQRVIMMRNENISKQFVRCETKDADLGHSIFTVIKLLMTILLLIIKN
jgi:hypothetical protein